MREETVSEKDIIYVCMIWHVYQIIHAKTSSSDRPVSTAMMAHQLSIETGFMSTKRTLVDMAVTKSTSRS